MKRIAMLMAVALLSLAACDKKEAKTDDPADKNATTTGATASATAAAQPVTINDSDLSTPADFEDSAESTITKANYKQELANIEKDIDKP